MGAKIKRLVIFSLIFIGIVLIGIMGYVKIFLPDVGPAPEIIVEMTPKRVERGSYLANHVAVCMDCHSTRDWSRFSAPLVDGTLGKGGEYFGPEMGFPGKFYSKNLTPAHLGEWTDGEIFRAITSGVSRKGEALFPVMPYKYYGKMNRQDIYDIIAYLRSLAPIASEVPESEVDFPMNFILNTLPAKARLVERPVASERTAYGAYLVNAAGCIECHTPADKGQLLTEKAFAGGRRFEMPGGVLYSANITPDQETGIGSWSQEAFVARFKAFESPESAPELKEGAINSVMPWSMYAGMKKSDLEAIYAYLRTLRPVNNKVVVYSIEQKTR